MNKCPEWTTKRPYHKIINKSTLSPVCVDLSRHKKKLCPMCPLLPIKQPHLSSYHETSKRASGKVSYILTVLFYINK